MYILSCWLLFRLFCWYFVCILLLAVVFSPPKRFSLGFDIFFVDLIYFCNFNLSAPSPSRTYFRLCCVLCGSQEIQLTVSFSSFVSLIYLIFVLFCKLSSLNKFTYHQLKWDKNEMKKKNELLYCIEMRWSVRWWENQFLQRSTDVLSADVRT